MLSPQRQYPTGVFKVSVTATSGCQRVVDWGVHDNLLSFGSFLVPSNDFKPSVIQQSSDTEVRHSQ
jgi:hypothetical protein